MQYIENQYDGQGIYKTPAYNCTESQDILERTRNEFWETRTQGNPICWVALRNSIETKNEQIAL